MPKVQKSSKTVKQPSPIPMRRGRSRTRKPAPDWMQLMATYCGQVYERVWVEDPDGSGKGQWGVWTYDEFGFWALYAHPLYPDGASTYVKDQGQGRRCFSESRK